jgi:isoaspartyl peptidase/L-asparaginase-like protein (Ntn-hydrolase superfamily)
MRELTGACDTRLQRGDCALDVVEYAVAELESSGLYVAGKGSAPNTAGYVELDASIMDGATREAGAVAAVTGVANPVRAARQVMRSTPHVMLAGNGARAFADAQGLEMIDDPGSYYVLPVGVLDHEIHEQSHGTVGAVALDQAGGLAAATSTGGTFGKLEGRVGDSPLIGSGTWADDHAAVSFTGTGEYIIRAGGAVTVAHRIAAGEAPETAIAAVLAEIERLGGDAGAIVVTRQGDIAMVYNSQGMKRASSGRDSELFVATFEGGGS